MLLHLLTKLVPNDIQYQANMNPTPSSNNHNDCIIESSPFDDCAALQSAREGSLLRTPSSTDNSRPWRHGATAMAHSPSSMLSQTQQHQNPNMSFQEGIGSQTAFNDNTYNHSDVQFGLSINESQFPGLTLMDDLFALPKPTQMSEYLSSAEPIFMDELLSTNNSQISGLLYMDDIFANPEPMPMSEYLPLPEPVFMDNVFPNE